MEHILCIQGSGEKYSLIDPQERFRLAAAMWSFKETCLHHVARHGSHNVTWKLQDGTEDTTPSSATPLDDASDTTAAPAPALPSSSITEDDGDGPSANGFHLPNGSTVIDSDGFRRQHERRPAANTNARPGPRRAEHQQSDDSFRCILSATLLAEYSLWWDCRRGRGKELAAD